MRPGNHQHIAQSVTRAVNRLAPHWRAPGFTLVELMVTLAVGAILAMIAVPSFQRIIVTNRLNTTANAIVNAVNVARMNAIKLNATTQFCGNTTTTNTSDTLGTACGTHAGAVYALPHSAATAGEVSASMPGITPPVQIAKAGVTAVRFSGQGFGYAPGSTPDTPFGNRVAVICTTRLASNNQRIVNMTAGSILATASSTGSCP